MKGFRSIVFATDFSPASAAAGRRALSLAREGGTRLWIVHAVEPLAEGHGLRWAYRELEREMQARARKNLDRLERRARKGRVRASGLLAAGKPHEAIVRAARAKRANLIVIGTHGRTGLAGAFVGSVAARVMATAPCPVLTVRSRGLRR